MVGGLALVLVGLLVALASSDTSAEYDYYRQRANRRQLHQQTLLPSFADTQSSAPSIRSGSASDMALSLSGALPGGRTPEEAMPNSLAEPWAPLKYTILLSSDSKITDKCIETSESLRKMNYTGSISYVTELDQLDSATRTVFDTLNVEMLDLKTILELGNPGDGALALLNNTPPRCDFAAAFTAKSPPRSNDYSWGPGAVYAAKRAKGWGGYYWKVLAAFNSYWRTSRMLDRILWLDCGAVALAPSIETVFTHMDSTDKLIAQDDWVIFGKSLRDGCERACNETTYNNLWGSYDDLLGDRSEIHSFNSAFMIYDTALLGQNNSELHEIRNVFMEYPARTVSGDQEVLNFHFGPLNKNKWTNVPTQRPGADEGSCFYAYLKEGAYQPTNCTNYLIVKSNN